MINDKYKVARLKCAADNLYTYWNSVIFSDETPARKGPQGRYRWIDTDDKNSNNNTKHHTKINIFSRQCRGKSRKMIIIELMNRRLIIDGILDANQYVEILIFLIWYIMINNYFSGKDDNDPVCRGSEHRSEIVLTW